MKSEKVFKFLDSHELEIRDENYPASKASNLLNHFIGEDYTYEFLRGAFASWCLNKNILVNINNF